MTERTPEEQAVYDALPPEQQRMVDVLDDDDLHIYWDEETTFEEGHTPPLFTTLAMATIGVYHPVLVLPADLRERWEAQQRADGVEPRPHYHGEFPAPRSDW